MQMDQLKNRYVSLMIINVAMLYSMTFFNGVPQYNNHMHYLRTKFELLDSVCHSINYTTFNIPCFTGIHSESGPFLHFFLQGKILINCF